MSISPLAGKPAPRELLVAEAHIVATTQAICDYRRGRGIDGPLFMGKDTHAVSGPAERTALEVLALAVTSAGARALPPR